MGREDQRDLGVSCSQSPTRKKKRTTCPPTLPVSQPNEILAWLVPISHEEEEEKKLPTYPSGVSCDNGVIEEMLPTSPVGVLCDGVVEEILLRLPPKSVMRFQVACRRWQSLASGPGLRIAHARHHGAAEADAGELRRQTRWFYQERWSIFLPCPGERRLSWRDRSTGEIFHCCNGLMVARRWKPKRSRHKDEYVVLNPATRELKRIPDPPDPETGKLPLGRPVMYMAFSPAESPHYWILHRRTITEELDAYLVDPPISHAYPPPLLSIYSSSAASWRPIDVSRHPRDWVVLSMGVPPVFLRGALNWWHETRRSVFSFHVEQERVRFVPGPTRRSWTDSWTSWWPLETTHLGQCRGRLHLVSISDVSLGHVEVMELDGEYEGWSCKYEVRLSSLHQINAPRLADAEVVGMVSGRAGGDCLLLLNVEGSVLSLDLKSHEVETTDADDVYKVGQLCCVMLPSVRPTKHYGRLFCVPNGVPNRLMWLRFFLHCVPTLCPL